MHLADAPSCSTFACARSPPCSFRLRRPSEVSESKFGPMRLFPSSSVMYKTCNGDNTSTAKIEVRRLRQSTQGQEQVLERAVHPGRLWLVMLPTVTNHQLSAYFERAAVYCSHRHAHHTPDLLSQIKCEAQPSSSQQLPYVAELRLRRLVCQASPAIAQDVRPIPSESLPTPSSTHRQARTRLRHSYGLVGLSAVLHATSRFP